ncbi:hypothetical protein EV2_019457 [Malus domestica]
MGSKNWESFLECAPTLVSDSMNESLLSSISDVEIQDVMMQMGGLQAPRPDGFQGVFYHSFWETLREDVHALKAKRQFELGIKLDMRKAYDRVEWDFLDTVTEKMGFHSRWRKIIIGCINSVNFAVLLKGQPGAKFAPSRGLRQGDPLSPYLFLFVRDVLSRMINSAVEKKYWEGVKMTQHASVISHIFFADDALLFLKATKMNCCHLVNIIEDYCNASGQAVVSDPGTYLGVFALWGISKRQGLAFVENTRVETK